jgi:hypothetical protein
MLNDVVTSVDAVSADAAFLTDLTDTLTTHTEART